MTKRTTAGTALLALGGALAIGHAGPARAATSIGSCPYTITAPGTYVLTQDLTCPRTAITVTADGVRLVLGGRTITGNTVEDHGVRAEGTDDNPVIDGLSVEGGTIAGFEDGVHLRHTAGARVTNVTSTGNYDDGVEVQASTGARIANLTSTGNDFGVYLNNCEGCQVTGSRFADTPSDGIVTAGAPRARISGNTVAGSGGDGIDLSRGGCAGCRVEGNRIEGAGDGNGDDGDDGIEVGGDVAGALLSGNTADGGAGDGIFVDEGSAGATFRGNRATGNAGLDIDDRNLPACANAYRGNQFVTDDEAGADAGPDKGCIR